MDSNKQDQIYPGLDETEPSPLQEQRSRKIVHNGQLIEELLLKEVWQDILGPMLHDMITNSVGQQKSDGRWNVGDWARKETTSEQKHYNAGYSAALMEFSNFLVDSVKEKNRMLANQRLKQAEQNNEELVHPMEDL